MKIAITAAFKNAKQTHPQPPSQPPSPSPPPPLRRQALGHLRLGEQRGGQRGALLVVRRPARGHLRLGGQQPSLDARVAPGRALASGSAALLWTLGFFGFRLVAQLVEQVDVVAMSTGCRLALFVVEVLAQALQRLRKDVELVPEAVPLFDESGDGRKDRARTLALFAGLAAYAALCAVLFAWLAAYAVLCAWLAAYAVLFAWLAAYAVLFAVLAAYAMLFAVLFAGLAAYAAFGAAPSRALAVPSRPRPRAARSAARCVALFFAVQLVGRLLAGVALPPRPSLSPKQG